MRRDDRPALASNWRTILVLDAVLGWAMVVAGVVFLVSGRVLVGGLLLLAGVVYLVIDLRRLRRWQRLRREAGLD